MGNARTPYCLWSGNIQSLPVTIDVDMALKGIDALITPVNTLRYHIGLYTSTADRMSPCSECMNNTITDAISYTDLSVTSRGRDIYVRGEITIRCDGTDRHRSACDYVVLLVLH
jgi:hypothetical protein